MKLLPSVSIIKEWKSPKICTMDEWIDDIVYNNKTLVVIISNKVAKSVRIELRNCEMLNRLWSLPLDVAYNTDLPFRCCSLDDNGWLVADFRDARLLHITTDGKMKETITYKVIPYRIALFTPDILAVSTTSSINFHKIQGEH
jgi:hypothetical protein